MIRKRVPRNIWDYGVLWTAQVMQRTSTQPGGLREIFPLEDVTEETPDTSEYLNFGFYDHVSCKDNDRLGMTAIIMWLGADPDLWLRPAVMPDGFKYYEYIIFYLDDVLCISHKPRKLTKGIQEDFKLKDDKIEPTDVYIGSTLAHMKLKSGNYCWTMFPEQYVKAAVTNVE